MKKAIIFDLDGVIVSTDEFHYEAWKKMADEEKIYFDKEINHQLRGVSRMESLLIILRKSDKQYNEEEKCVLAERKNEYYRKSLERLSEKDILPGVTGVLEELKKRGVKTAIGSSSKNTMTILKNIGLLDAFDVIVDGNAIKNSKPDPEVFLKAAEALGFAPEECTVIEDAKAGIDAALAGGMKAVGVGPAAQYDKVHAVVKDMSALPAKKIVDLMLED